MSEPIRSRQARDLAEAALVRLVRAYGDVPEFVLLGGLVPDLLCGQAPQVHVGTTDVDVQVNLEIQGGSVNAARLERALKEAGFRPDSTRVWRWKDETAPGLVVKAEFLADLDDVPAQTTVMFKDCETLGAANLRGTGFASQAWELRSITANIDGSAVTVNLRVATLPGYLLAKIHAAYARRLEKDWYDIAYVLIHNDAGGPAAAGAQVNDRFSEALVGETATALTELSANFSDENAQGTRAYVETMLELYPELDSDVLANDAIAAVAAFIAELKIHR
jgi:hypothetical protein